MKQEVIESVNLLRDIEEEITKKVVCSLRVEDNILKFAWASVKEIDGVGVYSIYFRAMLNNKEFEKKITIDKVFIMQDEHRAWAFISEKIEDEIFKAIAKECFSPHVVAELLSKIKNGS